MKYSVAEIEYMRELIRLTVQYHPYVESWTNWYSKVDNDMLEARLQTHMMNGTKPKEIKRVLKKRIKKAQTEVDRLVDEGYDDVAKNIQETMRMLKADLRGLDAVYRNK